MTEAPTIFMIDNEVINERYDKYIVDESYLLNITIELIEIDHENIRFNLINILTKSEENIKKSKEVILKGVVH